MSTRSIIISTLVSFLIMFGLTYAAIDIWGHFYFNINKVYMAAVMSSPMLVIKVLMAKDKLGTQTYWSLLSSGVLLTILFFLAIRTQFLVGNEQFLRSMIPHHSSAIVMCERSKITDERITSLCEEIVQTQKEEIAIMQDLLEDGGN